MSFVLDTDTFTSHDSTDVNCNVMFLLAANALCFLGIAVGAKAAGMGWGFALLVAWFGGAALTLAIVAAIVILWPVASQRLDRRNRGRGDRAGEKATLTAQWLMDAEDEAREAATLLSTPARIFDTVDSGRPTRSKRAA
jgi:hypothetical protein